jgi:hypothetical protein
MNTKDTILKKLGTIEYLDPKYVIKELSKLNTIKERVAQIKEMNKKHYDKFVQNLKTLSEEEQYYYYENKEYFQEHFFGSTLTEGMLVLQEPVFEKFFKSIKDSAEYKYEMNLYYAEVQFQKLITSSEFVDDLNSNLKNVHLEKRLNKLKEESDKSLMLYNDGILDKNKFTWTDSELYKYKEIFRVLNGDYSRKDIQPLSISSLWQAMRDHLFLRPYLENLLKENVTVSPGNLLIKHELNMFCRSMPLSIPKEHFRVFTLNNSSNGKPFLTEEQFSCFIDRAFCYNMEIPKQKFNQSPKGEKLKIQYVFRQFYENYCFEYFDSGNTQDLFIKLLTENFIGWDFHNVKNNFKTKPKIRI